MQVTMCRAYGDIDVLTHEEHPAPPLRPGCVRVDVEAAGVSFANTVAIAGRHQNSPAVPFVPGTEMVGTVREASPGVGTLAPGDRVMATLGHGAFASEIVADPHDLYPIPADLDPYVATSLPTLYGTTLAALRWRAHLAPGAFLLVHGAGGGTGLAAVDLGRVLGGRVIAVAGSEAKLRAARETGAEFLIDHRTEDVRERVLEITGGRGADVVYDPVGGEAFRTSMRCTAQDGVILVIGFASGDIPSVALNHLLVKNVTVSGFYWGFHIGIGRVKPDETVRAAARALMAELVGLATSGRIRPRIYRVLDHAQVKEALRLVRDREVIGKVALRMASVRCPTARPG